MKLKEKVGVYLAYLMQGLIIVLIGVAVYNKNYIGIFNGFFVLIIMSLPFFLRRRWNITLPWTLNLLIMLSLFLHTGGIVGGWYRTLYPFYDKFAHLIGSITIALLGFASVLVIDRYTKVELTNKSIIFFVIIFTLAVGSIWEIGEFLLDTFVGTNAQYDGLEGTMFDLILDSFGGIIAGSIAYFNLRKGKEKFIDKLLKTMKLKLRIELRKS